MKKIFLILNCVLCLFTSAFSQTSVYHRFPDANAGWNVYYFGGLIVCPSTHQTITESYSYTLGGDTSIGAFIYHEIFIPYVLHSNTCTTLPVSGYAGAIREDTVSKKVFYVVPNDTAEQVLYDFSLSVGDTIKGYRTTGQQTIAQIDSILIGGDYRKQWTIAASFGIPPVIIEGIGSSSGLLETLQPRMPDGNFWSLTCLRENERTLYPDSTTVCDIVASVKNITEENSSVSISPQPFHTTATFSIYSTFNNRDSKLLIYDMTGRMMKSIPLIFSNGRAAAIISRMDFPEGMYFHCVRDEMGVVARGKFVAE